MKKIIFAVTVALVACGTSSNPQTDAGNDAGQSDASNNDAANNDAGCASPKTACSGTCVDTTTDAKNCGACGTTCFDNHCAAGECDHVVFLSSVQYFVDLGVTEGGTVDPLSAADAYCNTLAKQSSMPGTYKAWLATDTSSPSTRFTQSKAPYVLPDGTTVVANDWGDLTKGTLQHAIDLTEQKLTDDDLLTRRTMTNVATDGTTANPSLTCSAWTSKSANASPTVGDSKVATSDWTKMATPDPTWTCALQYHIYCFQQ